VGRHRAAHVNAVRRSLPHAALIAAALLCGACAGVPMAPAGGDDAVTLSDLLASDPRLARIAADAGHFRLQVVLGTIVRDAGGRARLRQETFRAGAEYFYPASCIKLFAAVAALERVAALRSATGLPLGVDTPLVYHPLFAGETLVDTDPGNLDGGAVTVRYEIRKLFLVSDNEAFNRLYELVGQDGLAASLARAGFADARIVHRLDEPRSDEENRRFPRIDFAGDGWTWTLPERTSAVLPPAPAIAGLEIGAAYLTAAGRVEGPMDFARKNRFALADLQRGLCMIVAPGVDCGGAGFVLTDADRALLAEAMRELPRESANPVYAPDEFPDDYVKYFLPGLRRVLPAARVTVYNKIGQAYGFTTENAWIVDEEGGRSFFLAATLYTNEDGVLNDDHYEYDTVAEPFLADLAEVVARRVWGIAEP
jgi:hypothetical protein